jgi:hypothetical protein
MRLMFICEWTDKNSDTHERLLFNRDDLIELREVCASRSERFTFKTETY